MKYVFIVRSSYEVDADKALAGQVAVAAVSSACTDPDDHIGRSVKIGGATVKPLRTEFINTIERPDPEVMMNRAQAEEPLINEINMVAPVRYGDVLMPANHSFDAINEFVHHPDVQFEELQDALLGMATSLADQQAPLHEGG